MSDTKFTDAEVSASIHKALALKGADYIYERQPLNAIFGDGTSDSDDDESDTTCAYRKADGSPSCIVGHVLIDLGLERYIIEGSSVYGLGLDDVPRDESVPAMTSTAMAALDAAQSKQDKGIPWGEAVEAFDRALAAA